MTRLSVYVIVNDEVPKKTFFLAPNQIKFLIFVKTNINDEL